MVSWSCNSDIFAFLFLFLCGCHLFLHDVFLQMKKVFHFITLSCIRKNSPVYCSGTPHWTWFPRNRCTSLKHGEALRNYVDLKKKIFLFSTLEILLLWLLLLLFYFYFVCYEYQLQLHSRSLVFFWLTYCSYWHRNQESLLHLIKCQPGVQQRNSLNLWICWFGVFLQHQAEFDLFQTLLYSTGASNHSCHCNRMLQNWINLKMPFRLSTINFKTEKELEDGG